MLRSASALLRLQLWIQTRSKAEPGFGTVANSLGYDEARRCRSAVNNTCLMSEGS